MSTNGDRRRFEATRRFDLEIADFFEKLPQEIVKPTRDKIALQALRGVVLRTPVDTGRARGAWLVGEGAAVEDAPDTKDKTGAAAISAGTRAILAAEPYGAIHISNNLPYILKLEDGSSQQAPAGMVGLTLAEIEAQFRVVS